MLIFEWDLQKAESNFKKHRVTFEEATTIFGDPLALTRYDPDHSTEEDRFITIGESQKKRIVVVIHKDFVEKIRIISARLASKSEREIYEEVE